MVCNAVFFIYAFITIGYSEYALFGYGAERSIMPLVTESMPLKNPISMALKTIYCVVPLITYPTIIFPVNKVIDSYTISDEQPRSKQVVIENLTRAIGVFLVCTATLAFYHKLPYVNAIAGALFCCPMAFTLPVLFHLKLGLANSRWKLIKDYVMLVFSIFATIFTTEEIFRTWNEEKVFTC